MDRKKCLSRLLVFFLVIGMAATTVPFARSWRPNVRAENGLWEMDASQLLPSNFRVFHQKQRLWYGSDLLVLRDFDGTLQVFYVPVNKDGAVRMPEIHWFHTFFACADFGPDAEQGHLKPGGVISCKDAPYPYWQQMPDIRWTYKGKSLIPMYEDMLVPHYWLTGDRLLVEWQDG